MSAKIQRKSPQLEVGELKLGHVLGLSLGFLGRAGKGGQKGLSQSQEVTNEISAP